MLVTAVRPEEGPAVKAVVAPPSKTTALPQAAPPEQQTVPIPAPPPAATPPGRFDPAHTRSLLVILHGKRVDDELVREALTILKAQGHRISVRVTFDAGDAEAFVAEAVRLNDAAGAPRYQTIVAGGGDGTLNEVVCALLQHRDAIQRQGLAVALLPLGTANDFACVTGISVDPLVALFTALDPSNIHMIDVATVNGRPFINLAVVGRIAHFSPAELVSQSKWKRVFGPAAIAVQMVKRLFKPRALQPFKQASITFCQEPAGTSSSSTSSTSTSIGNGRQSTMALSADLLMLAAGNSRQMGRTLNVCPFALLDDGLLDFTLLTGASLVDQAAGLLGALASGDPDDTPCDSGICQLKASWLCVTTSQAAAATTAAAAAAGDGDEAAAEQDLLPVNRDGEPEDPSSSLVFEVLPRMLPMHLPDDRMLQSSLLGGRAASAGVPSAEVIRGNIHSSSGTSSGDFAAAGASSSDGAAEGSRPGRHRQRQDAGKGRQQRKKLRKRTLQMMVVAAQPVGLAVRQRQKMMAMYRQLTKWGLVLLAGGVLGWAVRARRESSQKHQHQGPAATALHQQQHQRQHRHGRGKSSRPVIVSYDL